MTRLSPFACAALLAGGLAFPAFAAGADTNQNTTGATSNGSASSTTSPTEQNGSMRMKGANGPAAMHIAQKMRTDLGKAGFTDIHIMPSSFLVRAKDSSGNPVMMVINPDSVTEITEQNSGANNSASSATHNGANTAGANTTGSQPATSGASKTKP